VVRAFETPAFEGLAARFRAECADLAQTYRAHREQSRIPVKLPDGATVLLSPGEHNRLHKAVLEEFLPRFGRGADVLYVGDTDQKDLIIHEEYLSDLGIPVNRHDKLPDVVAYTPDLEWLFLIEAVTSHGPVTPKRMFELEEMLSTCTAGRVYVSAFPDMRTFRMFAEQIAWETEVWIADSPGHLLHFNGDRFLGPRR
jgi:type II restriction enzyme